MEDGSELRPPAPPPAPPPPPPPPPPPAEHITGNHHPWTSFNFMLKGESMRTNPYLQGAGHERLGTHDFCKTQLALIKAFEEDPNFRSWANVKGKHLRKEICEASAVLVQLDALIQKRTNGCGGEAKGEEKLVIFDLCSGKGFLSIMLAFKYPHAVRTPRSIAFPTDSRIEFSSYNV
eukprot:1189205-Prorocentrum_minimum.AAC.2